MISKVRRFYRMHINPHCSGLYNTFEEAQINAKGQYDSSTIAKVVVKKTENYLETIKNSDILLLDYSSYRISFVLLDILANAGGSVIDLGGAAGTFYHIVNDLLIKMNINIKLDWSVIETEAMVNEASLFSNDHLRFVNIEDYKKSLNDNVFSNERLNEGTMTLLISGSLQFMPNCMYFFEKILNTNFYDNIFITRTAMTNEVKTLYSIQKSRLLANGPGASMCGGGINGLSTLQR